MTPRLSSDQNHSMLLVCTSPRTYSCALWSTCSCGNAWWSFDSRPLHRSRPADTLAIRSCARSATWFRRRSIFDDLANDVALARDRADDGSLAGWCRAPVCFLFAVAIAVHAADVGLIHFDFAHQFRKFRIVHPSADTLRMYQAVRYRRFRSADGFGAR